MTEENPHLNLAALFHSVLFAYEKTVSQVMSKSITIVFHDNLHAQLDRVLDHLNFVENKKGDPYLSLKAFGEYLEKSQFVERCEVKKRYGGYDFNIINCAFANHIHKQLDPEDVICPYAVIAHIIAEKCENNRTRKSLTKFTETDAFTVIDFDK